MKRFPRLIALLLTIAVSASAATVDFESTTSGVYTELAFADFTITAQGGKAFDVVPASPGFPIVGQALITFFSSPGITPLTATFSLAGVTSFSIGVGDFNQDIDNTYLKVYDASWNLLASDYYQNPAIVEGGDYLSVTTTESIKYAVFHDEEPFAGAVYWDNITYSTNTRSVPENASSMLLVAMGLGMMAVIKRKRIS